MVVSVLEYEKLSKEEKSSFDLLTAKINLYQQLWFIALLADQKVKIFIFGEYETLLFVPYRSKFGMQYAYMPSFLQKLSFIGSQKGVDPILNELISHLRFGEICFENLNSSAHFELQRDRKNYVLKLNNPYHNLSLGFSENHRRNCKKAKNLDVNLATNLTELVAIFKTEKLNSFTDKKMDEIIRKLKDIETSEKLNGMLEIYNANDGAKTVSSILIIKFNEVIYYLLGTSQKTNKSLSTKGLFRLFDFLIEKYADTNLTLDFEGSDISGIARFFKGFGAKETNYCFVKWNRLPFPFKLLKK
jgi:hypothetical protein